uniref:Facilitated trehalose transporter Tret1 n=1 Tax=Lygus hesperus TaxID=30085 RepID=A0A146LH82_LYGHE
MFRRNFHMSTFEDDFRQPLLYDAFNSNVPESTGQMPAMGIDGEAGVNEPESNDPGSEVRNAGRWKQYYATFVVCLAAYATGLASGWASPMLIRLKSNDSPVGNMTLTEMSYLESIPTISGLVAVYLFGAVVDTFGRKPAGYVVGLFSIAGWLLLVMASSPLHLYIGRFFTGFSSVGGLMVGPIFLSEVVHETRRGTLMAFIMVLTSVAQLQSFVLGDVLSYRLFNISCIISPLLFPLLFYWLPESPFFLCSKSRLEDAQTSLLWYRGGNKDVVSQELSNISNSRRQNQSYLSTFKSKTARKAISIVIFMFSFQQLGGSQVISGFASLIFEDSGDPIPPNTSAIILSVIRLVATCCSLLLIDRVSRRFMMISTFFVMGVSLAIMSTFFYMKQIGVSAVNYYSWIPLACLCTFTLVNSVGVGTLPEVISNEVVPPQIKGASSMISGTVTLSVMFLCLQAFTFIRQHIGMYANFVYPSFTNFLACIIAYHVLPETRGKSLNEILNNLDEGSVK